MKCPTEEQVAGYLETLKLDPTGFNSAADGCMPPIVAAIRASGIEPHVEGCFRTVCRSCGVQTAIESILVFGFRLGMGFAEHQQASGELEQMFAIKESS